MKTKTVTTPLLVSKTKTVANPAATASASLESADDSKVIRSSIEVNIPHILFSSIKSSHSSCY
jgi:hypothetical protein